jgi:tetratricopeptide (TPR) repeat protein
MNALQHKTSRVAWTMLAFLVHAACLILAQDKQLVPPGAVGKRTALVIGNSSYSAGQLKNPVNDAQDIRAVLKAMGFIVNDCCDNVTLRKLTESVDSWTSGLQAGDIAVFYYSGHGIRIGSTDYIQPIDFSASSEADVPWVAYPVDRLVAKIQERGTSANLIVLDACRNNPYVVSKGPSQGLAGVDVGLGTLIMFAAAQGKTASDNDVGRNSLFTSVLLDELKHHPVLLSSLQRKVKVRVYELSRGSQIPYTTDGLVYDLQLDAQVTLAQNQGPTNISTGSSARNPPSQQEMTGSSPSNSSPTPSLSQEQRDKIEQVQKANERIRYLNGELARARDLEKSGNYDQAIIILRHTVETDPTKDLLWAYLGEAYVGAKRYPEAVDAYQKAIAIKGDSALYHNALANAYGKSGQVEKAVAEYNQVAQMDPTIASTAYFNIGAVYTNGGKVDYAIAAFDKSLQLDPNRAEAYYWKGINLMGKATTNNDGKFVAPSGTAECFQKYLELKPDGPLAQQSKDMLASLGSSVETTYGKQQMPAKKKP